MSPEAQRIAIAEAPRSGPTLRHWAAMYRDEIRAILEMPSGLTEEQRRSLTERVNAIDATLRSS